MVMVLSMWERLLTVLCFPLVLAGLTDMGCQIDDIIYKVNNITSVVSYKIILQDWNYTVKKECTGYLTPCVAGENVIMEIKLKVSGGQFEVCYKGMWKIEVPPYESKCFSAPGLVVIPSVIAIFNERGLSLTFREPDKRVKTWDLHIYQAQEKRACDGTWKLKEIDRIPSVGNRSSLVLKYRFNLTCCYCFRLYPIGIISLKPVGRFSVGECKPEPEIRDPRKKNNIEFELWQVHTLVILTAVMVMAALAPLLYIIYKRRRYNYNTSSIGNNNINTAELTLHIHEVLLLYVDNLQHHQQAMKLKNYLKHYFKVNDLYKHSNMEQQADCTDWLLRTLLQSSTKIVLVDSPAMAILYRALSTLYNEQDSVEVLEEKHSMLQLRFALRHIITTSLMQDYSRIFVVRFDDASVEEEEVGHVVNSRWYNFPSQHNLLLNDISGC